VENPISVEELLLKSARIEDPLERAAFLHQTVLPQADTLRRQVIKNRAKAVAAAKRTHSYSKLAKELNCSKPLIQQLSSAGTR
jgi:hypothetical protein